MATVPVITIKVNRQYKGSGLLYAFAVVAVLACLSGFFAGIIWKETSNGRSNSITTEK